jgi:hypothetical protein
VHKPNVLAITVSPPDSEGFMSMGPCAGTERDREGDCRADPPLYPGRRHPPDRHRGNSERARLWPGLEEGPGHPYGDADGLARSPR